MTHAMAAVCAGQSWEMLFTLKRYVSKKRTSVIRQLLRWTAFAGHWGLQVTSSSPCLYHCSELCLCKS